MAKHHRTNLLIAMAVFFPAYQPRFAAAQESTTPTSHPNARAGGFAGLSLGASAINLDSIGETEIGDTRHRGSVGKVSLGNWFNRHLGISLEYLDLGEFRQTYSSGEFRGSAAKDVQLGYVGIGGKLSF